MGILKSKAKGKPASIKAKQRAPGSILTPEQQKEAVTKAEQEAEAIAKVEPPIPPGPSARREAAIAHVDQGTSVSANTSSAQTAEGPDPKLKEKGKL